MKTTHFLVASALAAALSIPVVAQAGPAPPPKKMRRAMPGSTRLPVPVTNLWAAASSPKSSAIEIPAADEGA